MMTTAYAPTAPAPATNSMTALVLDDDPMVRSEVGELLAEFGYRIRYCADFISAMQEMEFDDAVSLVVADYHLLGDERHTFNGMCFIDCCRMRYPQRNIRYFLMSGDRMPLSHNMEDAEVPMISKVNAIDELTAHIAPRNPASLC